MGSCPAQGMSCQPPACICTYIHIYIHIYTYIHIYICIFNTRSNIFLHPIASVGLPRYRGLYELLTYPCRHRGCPPCYAFRFLFASPSLIASIPMSNLGWLHFVPVSSRPGDFGATHLDCRCRPSGAYVLHA